MSAAEKFVTERNRELRLQNAEKDSLEHQVTLEEVNIINASKAIDEATKKMIKEGDFTAKKITEERIQAFEKWDKKARKAVQDVADRVANFDDNFTLPQADPTALSLMAQKFDSLSGHERLQWIAEARAGTNKEVALFLLHAPRTLTQITDGSFTAFANTFRSEKDMIKHERKQDLQYRARAVLDAYETEKRRLLS